MTASSEKPEAGQAAGPGPTPAGPVWPSAAAAVAHRPLGRPGARLARGLLHDWQVRNHAASLPLAVARMESAGNLGNLRLASSGAVGPAAVAEYRGPRFMDSDVYKTLEAIAWQVGRAPDAGLAQFAAEVAQLLEKAQEPDGYLDSYIQVGGRPRYAQLASSHELYCAGHLIQAAVAAQRAAAGPAGSAGGPDADGFGAAAAGLSGVATRLADHLVETFLGNGGNDGHPIIETALTELYRQTGYGPYLELASQFVEQRGYGLIGDSGFGSRYLQDHLPVREAPAVAGHAVRQLYLEAGIVDVAAETGDSSLLAASVARWDDMVATKTAITGGNGSRHAGEAFGDGYELPPDRAYNETCAAIASFHWSWRLLLATGDAKYADLMERVLYNGFGAAISADGRRFFYVNPLQRRADHYEDDDPGRRRDWFSCACCPPNIMRLLASVEHYLATVSGHTLYLHQYAGARLAARLPGGDLVADVSTDYPWSGRVEIRIQSAPAEPAGLALRIPAWAAAATVTAPDGQVIGQPGEGARYVTLTRRWQPGDVVLLSLDLTPRFTYPSRRIDALRGTAAVERGPLVYCFEQADQAADLEDLALLAGASGAADEGGAAVAGAAAGPGGLAELPAVPGGLDATIALAVPAAVLPVSVPAGLPFDSVPDVAGASGAAGAVPGRPTTAVAVPYFQWDNRDGRPMRVWLPLSRPAPADSAHLHAPDAAVSTPDPAAPGTGGAADLSPDDDRVPRPRRIA